MAQFVLDTFTGSDGVTSTAHTTDSGASWSSWSAGIASGYAGVITANRLRNGGPGGANTSYIVISSTYSADGNYDLSASMRCITAIPYAGLTLKSNAAVSAYYTLWWSGTAWQILKTGTVLATSAAYPLTAGADYAISVSIRESGSSVTIVAKVNGVTVASYTDTSAAILGAGRVGLFFRDGSATTGLHFDSFSAADYVAVTDSISITSPVANKLFRRAGAASISIPVTVAYVGSPTNIEARFNGGGWQSFTPTESPQTLSITGCAKGYGAIDVRFSNAITVTASVTPVAVGKVIAMLGQSNSSGRGTSNQTAPTAGAYLFKNDGTFAVLADPYDGGSNTYSVLDDSALAAGSYAPRLANNFVTAGEPVLIVPANKGGSPIASWSRSTLTTTLYGAMKARIDAVGGADVIVWHQGETDGDNSVSTATYAAALTQLVSDFQSDFSSPTVLIQKLQLLSGSESKYQSIRDAQEQVATTAPGAKRGADLLGVSTALHFTSTGELSTIADLTYAALNAVDVAASGGVGTSTGSGSGGTATGGGGTNAIASGGTGVGTGSGSGGTATGGTNPNASADGGTGVSTGSGSGGTATGSGGSLITYIKFNGQYVKSNGQYLYP